MTQKTNKYFAVIVLVLFTFSATGIPIGLHICRTMQSISLRACSMCNKNNTKGNIIISRDDNCCRNVVAASPLKGFYLLSKNENPELKIIVDLIPFVADYGTIQHNTPIERLNSHQKSPPGINSNPLFLTNRELLI